MARRKNNLTNFITWLLLLLLLACGIGAVIRYSGVTKDDITDLVKPTFRIECNKQVFRTNTENVFTIPKSGQARFDIKNCENCTVKVLPNVTSETDFTFIVAGKDRKYTEVGELTSAFIKTNNVYGDYFVIDFDEDYKIQSVLSRFYGTNEIILPEGCNPSYKVVVSSGAEKIEIILCFDVEKIELPESIVF